MSSDMCHKCGAKCCRYFCFEIDEPEDYEEFEDVRWYLCHDNVSVHIDDGCWFISILNPCRMLDENNNCRIYDHRPLICRKYNLSECDDIEGDYGHEREFNTPQELEAYARSVLGAEGFDRPRATERTGLAAKAHKATRTKNAIPKDKPRPP